uniref:Motile sperm domain-containing protein 2 n=1 Tax=Aceria tosichella TaxID=561515 RepID=A0A6G1SD63_9ACAR
MVQLQENSIASYEVDGNSAKNGEPIINGEHHIDKNAFSIKTTQFDTDCLTKSAAKSDALPEADVGLVEQVHALLKSEYEKDPEEFETIYSMAHYEELMNPDSPNTCWRYLLQRDSNVEMAFELIKSTLAWRKSNRIDEMTAEEMVKDFWLRAPIGLTGKTRNGNDLIYAIGKNFRKPDSTVKQAIRDFIAYLIFNWDRQHIHDLDQLELVFDVTDTGIRNIDLDFAFWLVSIRDFVPARIKAIYFVGIPFLIRPMIKLIISWLPERFRRIAYCGTYDELVRANIDDDCIPEEIGGKADSKWRLAPVNTKWAHEHDSPNAGEIFEKICKACNFNTSQEHLDKLYKMQLDYERSLESQN